MTFNLLYERLLHTRPLFEKKHAAGLDDNGTQVLQAIVRNTKKMSVLIDDLLSFSQLGRKQISFSEINMSGLVGLVVEDFLSEDVNIELSLRLTRCQSRTAMRH